MNTALVEQARAEAAWIGGIFVSEQVHATKGMQIASLLRQLADRVQEQQRTIESLNACIGGPGSLTTDNLTLVGRLEARVQELEGKSQPSSVQPEKGRRPLTDEQIDAAFDSSDGTRVGVARAIERAHGIPPSPSMVGREDTPHE